jgi:hypothetical protein
MSRTPEVGVHANFVGEQYRLAGVAGQAGSIWL